jgi:hydrogenase nickel incorporation protein HypA/HybF
MHEYSIALDLMRNIEAAAAPYDAPVVQRVHLRIGELAGVEAELLSSAFALVRAGTICADADLKIETSPAVWCCATCGETIATGAPLRCADCDEPARMDSGDEIMLARLEMEVP